MQANTATTVPAAQAGPAPKPRRQRNSAMRAEGDYHYRRALEFVQRRSYGTLADIRDLGIPLETARQALQRMQREGVIGELDMFGVWTRPQVQAEGVGHD